MPPPVPVVSTRVTVVWAAAGPTSPLVIPRVTNAVSATARASWRSDRDGAGWEQAAQAARGSPGGAAVGTGLGEAAGRGGPGGGRRQAAGCALPAIAASAGARCAPATGKTAEAITLGSRLSALGSRLSALGSRLSALGSRLSALGSRLSALGSRLSALGSRLSALGSRLSALIVSAYIGPPSQSTDKTTQPDDSVGLSSSPNRI